MIVDTQSVGLRESAMCLVRQTTNAAMGTLLLVLLVGLCELFVGVISGVGDSVSYIDFIFKWMYSRSIHGVRSSCQD